MLSPAFLAIALAAAAQDPLPDRVTPASNPSLNRIRARLSQPEPLHVRTDRELPEPTFRVEIHQHPYYTDVPFIWTFAGGGYSLTAPGLEHMGGSPMPKAFGKSGNDVLPLFMKLKRALDERSAKVEVVKALEEFCASHACVLPK